MSFALGQVVGDYEFVDVVRSSHSAVSYRVRNLAENRDELLKVVVADPRRDSDLIQRFLRESRIHSGLRHPNILTCHKAFELQSRLVMTMELVEATTLEDRLQTGQMPLEEACSLMQQVLRALAFAHDCSIVHREVTPVNILLTPEGIAKLSGFNLACVASDPRLTQVGAVVGPIHYMSPEQVRSESLDSRSDIYSLGVVLFEILAGRKPFMGKSHFDVLAAHVSTPPPALATIRGDLPATLCAVVERAMEKEPSARFQTCMEFAGALHRSMNPVVHSLNLERSGHHSHGPAEAATAASLTAVALETPPQASESLAMLAQAGSPSTAAPSPSPVEAETQVEVLPLDETAQPEPSVLLQRPLLAIMGTLVFILVMSWLIARMS
ncbi:MAG: serine/threonine-protein kinase [Bryobacteraceae bacterium]